jgi:hypothetical protein
VGLDPDDPFDHSHPDVGDVAKNASAPLRQRGAASGNDTTAKVSAELRTHAAPRVCPSASRSSACSAARGAPAHPPAAQWPLLLAAQKHLSLPSCHSFFLTLSHSLPVHPSAGGPA